MSDKVEERTDELSKLSQMMNTDVVVLTHVNMKLTEMEEANQKLVSEVEMGNEKIARVSTFIYSHRKIVLNSKYYFTCMYMSIYKFDLIKLKEEETELKSQLSELNKEYDKLDARVGLLGHKPLLDDYSKTLKHLDEVRKGVNTISLNNEPTEKEDQSDEGERPHRGSKKNKRLNTRHQTRRKGSGASSGGGIGSGESEISSPNERDNEGSNSP